MQFSKQYKIWVSCQNLRMKAKITFNVLMILVNTDKSQKRRIINIVKNNSEDSQKVKEVIDFVNASGGIEYTVNKMNEYIEKALRVIEEFPDSEAKNSLVKLIKYVVERGS